MRRPLPLPAFKRDDGTRLPLLAGYREHAKARWRKEWWATRVLLELDARGVLPESARELVDALGAASTLPAPVAEFAAKAAEAAEELPDVVKATGRIDQRLGAPVLAAVPRDHNIRAVARMYADGARGVLAALDRMGIDLSTSRVLEAGCGRGYTAAAISAAGAGEVVGLDLDLAGEALPEEVRAVHEVLAADRAVRLDVGDLHELPYPNGAFDVVFSLAVLEHVNDPARAFAELRRVTAPGGVGYHGVDPWFGPAGGHSLCTLDAPWGHVRLDEHEVARYLVQLRPHEADDALDLYRRGFQRPRLTIGELTAAARGAGFEVVSASLLRLPFRDPHRAWFSARVLRDCRRSHPSVAARDLLAASATLVLRRP